MEPKFIDISAKLVCRHAYCPTCNFELQHYNSGMSGEIPHFCPRCNAACKLKTFYPVLVAIMEPDENGVCQEIVVK
jgi:hypothetical protein